MAEEVSLATGDSTFVMKDCPAEKQSGDRKDQDLSGTVHTEVPDCPEECTVNDINSDADNAEVEVELQTERDGHCYDADTNAKGFEASPLSKSMDFMYETKYVMLNFMSLIPPEMYRGHISTSPECVGSEPEFSKRYLSKSKSFDTGIQHRKPHPKLLGKLRTMQKHLDSPASEDNVNYRYQNNWKKLDSPDGQRFNSDPCSPQALKQVFEKSQSSHEFSAYSSPSHSPQKIIHSPQRQYSDVSSPGDLSYMSDADDEFEEYSNASSIFSARSIPNRDGFLDLRRSVHILPTLPSQSEDLDEPDGYVAKPSDSNEQNLVESSNLATLTEEVKPDFRDGLDKVETLEGLQQAVADVDGRSTFRQIADRSKLKLNIPCEPVQLDDILLSLHTELSSEIDDMESEFEEALQSARDRMTVTHSCGPTPLTPQSEAARVLARIGDEVKEQYGARLAAAVNRLTYQQISSLSYQQFRDIAQSVVSAEIPGWRQVALLMVFGQKIVWGAVQNGNTQFGNLIDYSSQLVAEVAADFIIKQGGWSSVMNFDPSSDTQSSGDFDTSPEMLIDYFTSHDVTQVESEKCVNDGQEQNGNNGTCIDVLKQVNGCDNGIQNGEPSTAPMQTLCAAGLNESTATLTKSRYASSVGFDYTDFIADVTEADTKSDSEGDASAAFDEPEETDGRDGSLGDGHIETSDEKTHKKSQDEVMINSQDSVQQFSNDLNDTNIPGDSKTRDYDKDSIYVRQETPDVVSFENALANSVNTRSTSDRNRNIERKNVNSVTKIERAVENDAVGKVMEETVNGNKTFDKKAVNSKVVISPALKNTVTAVKQHTDDKDCNEKAADAYVKSVNNNNIYNEDASASKQGRDIPAKHSSHPGDLCGPNDDNQYETEIAILDKDNSYQDSEHEGDAGNKENKVGEREVTDESHIHGLIRRMGFKVAALALAVVVLGISVRFATLNR